MTENCEYCNEPMETESTSVPYGSTYASFDQAWCLNDDCPQEYQDCEHCDEHLKFEDGAFLPCECLKQNPLLIGFLHEAYESIGKDDVA